VYKCKFLAVGAARREVQSVLSSSYETTNHLSNSVMCAPLPRPKFVTTRLIDRRPKQKSHTAASMRWKRPCAMSTQHPVEFTKNHTYRPQWDVDPLSKHRSKIVYESEIGYQNPRSQLPMRGKPRRASPFIILSSLLKAVMQLLMERNFFQNIQTR
jgi:hypothetical protein